MDFEDHLGYKNMIDNADGTARFALGYAQWPINEAVCNGITESIEDLLSASPSMDAYHRWETGFILAKKYTDALGQKMINVDFPTYGSDEMIREILKHGKKVQNILSVCMAEISTEAKNDATLKKHYELIRDTYVPDIAEKLAGINDAGHRHLQTIERQEALAKQQQAAMKAPKR